MKRGEPLVRRTPLRTVARIRQQSTKRATQAQQFRAVSAAAAAREKYWCACLCGRPGSDPHHRQKQSRGGPDDLWNVVFMARLCHDGTEHLPALHERTGWLVPSWADPREWPVLVRGVWLLPTPDGWVPASPHPEQVRLLASNGESA